MNQRKPVVNLMKLGRNGLCAPGLENPEIKKNFVEALSLSDGNATTYPIDHIREHGAQHYYLRGMLASFDPKAVLEVAQEGRVMAMACLPALGRVIGRLSDGTMPLIWKMNDGAGAMRNGDYVTVRQYSLQRIEEMMDTALQSGARFLGATIYTGSENQAEMVEQLAELDSIGSKDGLGLVVWNYPRGKKIPKGHDADVFFQLQGAEIICNACPSALVLIKEKVSTLPGTIRDWELEHLVDLGVTKESRWGKPADLAGKDVDPEMIRQFLQMSRAEQIAFLVKFQHDNYGVASLMSGGAPQKVEQFAKDVEDGIGPDKHIAFIAGRSTTKQIVFTDGKHDISGAVAHMRMLAGASPRVVIEE